MNAPIPLSRETAISPVRRRWTRKEYHQLDEIGLFQNSRVELIGGEIWQMSPQSWLHAMTVNCVIRTLDAACVGKPFFVMQQPPIRIEPHSEPEPDVALFAGRKEDYADLPTRAELIVEVSLSTLRFDLREKASLYASASAPDNWIVNLQDRRLEVRRRPIQDAAAPFGWSYADVLELHADSSVTPLVLPDMAIAVANLFPPQADSPRDGN